ncbi:MAG: YaaA family protein [Muribaculaceae bacterium]|nr:YaaA family protein [Muribaculaceae bacterium]
MLILIAESKTMEKVESAVTPSEYALHTPAGEKEAGEIMEYIKEIPLGDLSSLLKISQGMAMRLHEMAYEFPNKSMGYKAIEAFTGVVFRNLGYRSLSEEDKEWTGDHVRIISSLYGWLKPGDIIKPYRLDYSSAVSPQDTPLYAYWRQKVTIELVRDLQGSGETMILDLLPSDAAKCIDWKLVKRFAKVWKVDFKEMNGESVRSPHAGKLKALRGELLRNIILHRFSTAAQISTFNSDTMMAISDYPLANRLGFYV